MGAVIPAVGSLFGGLGGFGSAISAIGSLVGAISSFMPKDTPDVPVPPAVQIPQSAPLPTAEAPKTASSILTPGQQQEQQLNEKRRRALLAPQQQQTMFAGDNPGTTNVKKSTLLGG